MNLSGENLKALQKLLYKDDKRVVMKNIFNSSNFHSFFYFLQMFKGHLAKYFNPE